ncbi:MULTISPECIES: flagellar brake protein [Bacillus]|uniref:flagellar brake protein n=1 Tax=Bacillus TaxID=1386 RepID=UPI001597033B|nr:MULTISPECIES: flagellar brake domain-containing protein [Bacillus]
MLKEGLTLTLIIHNENGNDKYRCKVQEVGNSELLIDYPIHLFTEKTTFLMNGTPVTASFVAEEGAAYEFSSEIIGRTKKAIPLIKLLLPPKETFTKIQRREYVRVESSVDTAVHSVTRTFKPFVTVTHDISAGGCAINLPKGVFLDEDAYITLDLVMHYNNDDIQYLKVEGKVIRMFEGVDKGRHRASIKFLNLKDIERQHVIKYCFEQQLLKRKVYS